MGLQTGWIAGAVALLVAGCAMEATDESVGRSSAALSMQTRAQVHEATLHANHGGYAWDRAGTYYDGSGENRSADMGSTDNSGRVSWKVGGWTETWDGTFHDGRPYNQVTTCTYGWCGSGGSLAGTLNGCIPGNNSESEWGYSYGACNSSAWGQRFAGHLEGVDRPVGSGDMVHSDYAAGASGTTTFGYHPYWAVTYNGECRIYQGWSYTTHNCFDQYVVNEPSVCGDGFCDDTNESCSSCAATAATAPPAATAPATGTRTAGAARATAASARPSFRSVPSTTRPRGPAARPTATPTR